MTMSSSKKRITNLESVSQNRRGSATLKSSLQIDQTSPVAAGMVSGTIVTIDGSGFAKNIVVFFGNQPSVSVDFESDTRIHAIAPDTKEVGTVPITVVNPDGEQVTKDGAFTYFAAIDDNRTQIFGVSPLTVVEETETEITLHGRHLIAAYNDGVLALRGPSRMQIKIASVTENKPDASGIESLSISIWASASPSLQPNERLSVQILASKRPGARDDLVVESSAQMFTVIPRDIPVLMAYTPNLNLDRPTMVAVLGENLSGCTLVFDNGVQTHLQTSDEHALNAIVTIEKAAARLAKPINLSVLDSNGVLIGRYSCPLLPDSQYRKSDAIPDVAVASRLGGPPHPATGPIASNFALDLIPVPNQTFDGPTEKDAVLFDLNGQIDVNRSSSISNFFSITASVTVRVLILNRVYIFPMFDRGNADLTIDDLGTLFPSNTEVGKLFALRGSGILFAARVVTVITVRVTVIFGIRFPIEEFLSFNNFSNHFPGAIGVVVIGIIVEVEIDIFISFVAAVILPDSTLRIIFIFQLSIGIDFSFSSDRRRLSFLPNITHSVRFGGITPFADLLPCDGRFQLADDNGQTVFTDVYGGHQSYYFARSAGTCCVPWRFHVELVAFNSQTGEETVRPPFDTSFCITAEPSPRQFNIIIDSVPPPTGSPPTLVLDLDGTATLRALAEPVDQQGNPTGEPRQDLRDLGYGVMFYLDDPLDVLAPTPLADGDAIATSEGSNLIRAAITSTRVIDDEQPLAFFPGTILGFDIQQFVAVGQQPRIRTGGLPVTVNAAPGSVKIETKLAYRNEAGDLVLTDNNEMMRSEPFEMAHRTYLLAIRAMIPRQVSLPLTARLTIDNVKMRPQTGAATASAFEPLNIANASFKRGRSAANRADQFFQGMSLSAGSHFDVTINGPRPQFNRFTRWIEVPNFNIRPNHEEIAPSDASDIASFVPPGIKVSGRGVRLDIAFKKPVTEPPGGPKISMKTLQVSSKIVNNETFEEYLRVFDEVKRILMPPGTQLNNFAENFFGLLFDNSSISTEQKLKSSGENLWRLSKRSVQSTSPYNDDRPLYWTRLQCIGAIKAFVRRSGIVNSATVEDYIKRFERASRGLDVNTGAIDFSSAPRGARKAIITGFDPFGLPSKPKRSNPSGLYAISVDSTPISVPGQGEVYVRSAVFPVRYADFDAAMVEDAIRLPLSSVMMIISMSENSGEDYYDIERWAAKNRGGSTDNNLIDLCNDPLGSDDWIESTLPFGLTITSQRELDGPQNANGQIRYPFVIDQSYLTLSAGSGIDLTQRRSVPATPAVGMGYRLEPLGSDTAALIVQADVPTGSAVEGSGGNYLSNEIFYRVAVVRKTGALGLATGHFHLPSIGLNPIPPEFGQRLIDGVNIAVTDLFKFGFRFLSQRITEFMNVVIGQSLTKNIRVFNRSGAAVTIKRATIDGVFTTLFPGSSPVVVPSGGEVSVPVTATPVAAGEVAGVLTLFDPNDERVLVEALKVKGVVNQPPPTISGFTPIIVFAGDDITLTGSNFVEVIHVKIGNTPVLFDVVDPQTIEIHTFDYVGFNVGRKITVTTLFGSAVSAGSIIIRIPI
jgi:pyrrolidone-carboxylate peptidase